MSRAERAQLAIEGSGDDDPDVGCLRRRERRGSAIDRGDERLVDGRDGVGFADRQRRDVAAPEREAEEERRQEARRETTRSYWSRSAKTREGRGSIVRLFMPPTSTEQREPAYAIAPALRRLLIAPES